MIDILGITIHEPDVSLTDLVLFFESLLFAGFLYRQNTTSVLLRMLFVVFFLSIAASSFSGAFFHAFFPDKVSTSTGLYLWVFVAGSIGITAAVTWCINAFLIRGQKLFRIVLPLSIIYVAILVYWVAFIDPGFLIIILFYIPPITVLTLISLQMFLSKPGKGWALFSGLLLTFVAAAVQQFEIVIHPQYFNHNALYHTIQAVALGLIFLGYRSLLNGRYQKKPI